MSSRPTCMLDDVVAGRGHGPGAEKMAMALDLRRLGVVELDLRQSQIKEVGDQEFAELTSGINMAAMHNGLLKLGEKKLVRYS